MSLLITMLSIWALLAGLQTDPGIVLSVDHQSLELRVRDERGGVAGPTLRVALGSPAHPTSAAHGWRAAS